MSSVKAIATRHRVRRPRFRPRLALAGAFRCTRGAVAIEFGFIAPFLIAGLIGLVDFGWAFYNSMALESAARAGVQYAIRNPSNTAGIEQVARDSTGLDPQSVSVTSDRICECTDGSSISCEASTICPILGGKRIYMRVQTQQNFTPLLPYQGLQTSFTLRGDAVLRVQ